MSEQPPFDPTHAILLLFALMIAIVAVIAMVNAINCFRFQTGCEQPGLRDIASQLIAALLGLYAGGRSR